MNKTKQEMLVIVERIQANKYYHGAEAASLEHSSPSKTQDLDTIRTLITDSVILSDGEIEGMKMKNQSGVFCQLSYNAALDRIKEIGK